MFETIIVIVIVAGAGALALRSLCRLVKGRAGGCPGCRASGCRDASLNRHKNNGRK